MRLYTPDNLHYPIKVTRILHATGDNVERNQTLFNYEYTSKVHESSAEHPEGYEVERTWPARFESELEGQLTELTITTGQILTRRTQVADIEEECKHEVQFGGICAICGTDVTSLSGYNSTIRDTDRATLNTVHGHTALLISHSEASRADEEAKRRLLDTRKLSLVVDLDQTIIHATVDPTVGEWQHDPSNPNHAAVKDVRAFNLVDDGPGARGCWYYIKLRPGLATFLDAMSKTYELHIYTMGTRTYAENIAKIIDPGRKIFGDRILSRDESGSLTAKTLNRLFPVDTRMVVIIDDRGDVWHWSPNLIKVSAYDFFVGIGDINSSFLPKRPELEAKPVKQTKTNGSTNGMSNAASDVSAVDHLVSMAGDQDAESMKEKTDEQDSALASQMADRPLLQKQKILDAADDETKASPAAEAAVELLLEDHTDFEHPKYRHNLLQDDDTELTYLTSSLQLIHKEFFNEYDSIKSKQHKKSVIPDAANIMRTLKSRVLTGVHLVFSGVVPLGVDIHAHDTVIWAKSFGAHVSENMTRRTTHVVASPERRTAKVRQAARKSGRVSIVSVAWLMACFSQWRRVPEGPYRIHSDAERRGDLSGGLPDSFGDEDRMALSSSEEGDLVTEDETEGTSTPLPPAEQRPANEINDELAKYGPTMQREDSSPTATELVEDWGDIDAELAEFLGSEAEDDSDLESTRTDQESMFPGKRKREKAGEESDADEGDNEGSRLQKRKKEALARTSSLISVTAAPSQPMDENDELEAALTAELLGDD